MGPRSPALLPLVGVLLPWAELWNIELEGPQSDCSWPLPSPATHFIFTTLQNLLYLYMKGPFRYRSLGHVERLEGATVGERGKQSTAITPISRGSASHGLLSAKMPVPCVPLSVSAVQSSARSAEEFVYRFIPQTFIENVVCPELEGR